MNLLTKVFLAGRTLFSREQLPEELPSTWKKSSAQEGFLFWLFRPESLGEDPLPPPSRKRPSFFSWLISREHLPEDPLEPKGKKSFWEMLFKPESLFVEESDKAGG